ncbi:DNA-binding transcriptional regulator, MarR family [Andreprevotia lacus DSM 23236]|jgi:DNA-binding MarR family transcriptional regulator|uniref:DNA-binding transcriptional regulator, MarR family n=1 Tax=Andreprevotia lacus DSM 23236 TaxID=1121001 RepID=A0A1W1XQQ2_9NEIS|nr:MarR family transcriptional regulator [Andreprevotia lacus]SMC26293.1 DNA-binding transcriptional regulator, MarR family [Andreprevotia lacus DSM 23236]
MARDRFLPLLRELARCYQAFELCSSRHLRTLGLTPAQFDIIATLGNTPGMSCGELGDKTLITKGTLTGVIDRLASRGLLEREVSPVDRRSVIVKLTTAGHALFDEIFPAHLAHLRRFFALLNDDDMAQMQSQFLKLRQTFEQDPDKQ